MERASSLVAEGQVTLWVPHAFNVINRPTLAAIMPHSGDAARVFCVAVIAATAGPAMAAPVPSPVTTPERPHRRHSAPLAPPPGSPFDEVVGGVRWEPSAYRWLPPASLRRAPSTPKAWLVADAESGRVLAALNPHVGLPPASTIKLLTAIALLPEVDANATYVVTDADVTVEGSRVGLVAGQRYSRDDLIHGLLLASGNDAANALAQLAGGQSRAVSLMVKEAERLGAYDTTATTTHGLDDPRQLTSA